MPTDPTTRSQVEAYRFMLRRMESALVRKDPVMQHEPMRNHLTATMVGVVAAVLGLAAFFVVGMFSPTTQVRPGDILVVKSSGAVFVVQDDRQLVPVLNVTSARLLVAALDHSGSAPPETKNVDESALAGFSRKRTTGLIGAPTLPSPENLVSGAWSVCETAGSDGDPAGPAQASTTVLIGGGQTGRSLGQDEALLVRAPGDATTYLVHDGHRSAIEPSGRVASAYNLGGAVPRQIGFGLLNAIPATRPLTPPDPPDVGLPAPFPQLTGVQVGNVVRVEVSDEQFFLLLRDGKQQVPQAVANVIRYQRGKAKFDTVAPEDIAAVPDAPRSSRLDFGDFPATVPRLLPDSEARNACLFWPGPGQEPVVSTSADPQLPLGQTSSAVDVPGGGNGQVADRVALPPGKGALVRSVVPGQDPDKGPIWLVSEQGLRYRVPSIDVARALGLGDRTSPAPQSILGLLPIGPELDPQRALELFDPALARQQQGGR